MKDAFDNYIPGDLPQLEFVKKHKPKVTTLTSGGNDVGFADILKYCAALSWEVIFVDDTCRYAKDPAARQELSNIIRTMYPDRQSYSCN